MELNLIEHPKCNIYKDWKEFTSLKEESAVLDLTRFKSFEDYIASGMNATARNRYRFSIKAGYRSEIISWENRNGLLKEIEAINTSATIRQGREMSQSYRNAPVAFTNTHDSCDIHYARFIGSYSPEGKLSAYITAHFCGELAASSQLLGHYDHLKQGIMLNLWACFVQACMSKEVKLIVYSRWNDGQDGLKYWKRSVGMEPLII